MQALIFCLILSLACSCANNLPIFQAYWESQLSYLYNDDELNNPWHIDLGSIDVGPPRYLGGPSVVTIDSADYCVNNYCQEFYPDEFCSKYPPEGVPDKPRAVEDWGTKYNITSNMITEGVKSIHEKGGKVILAYGGTLETDGMRTGITAMGGGGYFEVESNILAHQLAWRINENIKEWNLDGVDFFFAGDYTNLWDHYPGYNAVFHQEVISTLRGLVGSSKSISYSTIYQPYQYNSHDKAVIAACHKYLDFINVGLDTIFNNEALAQLEFFDVPLSKVGIVLNGLVDIEQVKEAARLVNEKGMSGISLFSINKENEKYRGEYAKLVAEALYK